MRSPTTIVFVVALVGVRCGSIDHDATLIAADLAGPDAIDCGLSDGNAFEDYVPPDIVRACMRDALEQKLPFFASVTPASADGGIVIGYASDGSTLWRVEHEYTIPIMFGCYNESIDEKQCDRYRDYGDDCQSLHYDLCFECWNGE